MWTSREAGIEAPRQGADEERIERASTDETYPNSNRVEEPEDAEEVEFVSHVDGDTAKMKINGKVETVRFLLIDTPETKHPKLGAQPKGAQAATFTKKMLEEADRITLQYDVEKRDKYNRVLAYVFADGVNVQEELLEKGLARVGDVYQSRRHLDAFKEAEKFARERGLGIWECSGYVASDGYKPEKWCKENEASTRRDPAHRGSGWKNRIMCPMTPKARIETVQILAPRAKRRHSMKRQGGPRRIPTAWTRTGMASPASRFHEGDDPFCGLPPRFPGRHFLCRRSADRFRNKPGPMRPFRIPVGRVLPLSPRDDGWPPFVDVAAMDQVSRAACGAEGL